MKTVYRLPLLLVMLASLSACGDSEETEIRAWMEAERKEIKVVTPKLSEPKVYVPFSYEGKSSIDPFDPAKLLVVLARLKAESSNGLKPDMERRREALEAFPMDSLKMVGTIEKNKVVYALIQADKTVYQVKAGGYVGQNFGKITSIDDDAINIKEIVQDAAGDWVEREAKLELQETKK
ncbi:pilus assembly protein PilP [Undibacterium sp. CY18W]|uniref:Pilus assembly protein PilP n=1 Tax=Undibacterium hunanense TaxID=2762292 RepID=A0ABR6ZYI3_9BURK|nr:pilus assembly protein PilP [Undibacterium hunanense]MBC3920693.1 pilus assembly protein PilP [Undibacterium hunanense]